MNNFSGKILAFFRRARTWFRNRRKITRITLLSILILLFAFLATDLIFPFRPRVEYSQVVLDKNDRVLYSFLTSDQKWRMQCHYEEISPAFIRAVIRKEDRWFWYHPGVNPVAVVRALWQNISHGTRISGASTITMQLARLSEHRNRTYLNKVIEMFHALQLELHYSKREILAMYLNLLPYGGNIEGVKSASILYFGQNPQALSLAQVVTLAIIPNNPHHLRLGIHNPRITAERNTWLMRWQRDGIYPPEECRSALTEPLKVKRLQAPRSVPHLAFELHRNFRETSNLKTYINPVVQNEVEQILSSEIQRLRVSGITNGAVVVINNRTGGIEAYAGSAGFDEAQYFGQVNGCTALRSPGSALKPFLYAMAMDEGLITPRTVLCDIPMNFGGYRPQNYDQTFRGQLPASQALALSLNLPAVDLLNRVGVEPFTGKLAHGGLRWIARKKNGLGLSVILGGCGVTLTELTSLYSSLALSGIHHKVRFLRDLPEEKADTLFSPEASWMVTEMLTNLKRPDLPGYFDNSMHLPHIAWKTGTSYGRRDAWSIGYDPDYTVGVWIGNFDGTGVPELSGSESAVPVLFRIFNSLCNQKQPAWFTQPAGIDYRLVCSESGLPPNDFCTNIVMDYYIPAVSGNRKCNHMVEVFTDPAGTISYCRNCLPAQGYTSQYYPNLSPALVSYYHDQQIPYKKIPPHNPSCMRVEKSTEPGITSLTDGKEYILYEASAKQLQLACDAAADVSRVYWYIDNKFYRACGATDRIFFNPGQGRIKISCCDDKGRNTDIYIRVRFL